MVEIYDVSRFSHAPDTGVCLPRLIYCLVHLERLGCMSEDAVRFYVAEIASALTFLHDKRIIHR